MPVDDRDYYKEKFGGGPLYKNCLECKGRGEIIRGHGGQKIRCPLCMGRGSLDITSPECLLCNNYRARTWEQVQTHLAQNHPDEYFWATIYEDLLNIQPLSKEPPPAAPAKGKRPKVNPKTAHDFTASSRKGRPTQFCIYCDKHKWNSIHNTIGTELPPTNEKEEAGAVEGCARCGGDGLLVHEYTILGITRRREGPCPDCQ